MNPAQQMKFTTELWRAARLNILVMEGPEAAWRSVEHLRVYLQRGTVQTTDPIGIAGHEGLFTVGQILGPCPPGPTERQVHPPGSMTDFHDAITAMILTGREGKAICWDRLKHWEVRYQDDYLPPGMRQILTGSEFNELLAKGDPIRNIVQELSPQLHNRYDEALLNP